MQVYAIKCWNDAHILGCLGTLSKKPDQPLRWLLVPQKHNLLLWWIQLLFFSKVISGQG